MIWSCNKSFSFLVSRRFIQSSTFDGTSYPIPIEWQGLLKCAHSTRILAVATIRERPLFLSAHLEVRLNLRVVTNRERRLIEWIRHIHLTGLYWYIILNIICWNLKHYKNTMYILILGDAKKDNKKHKNTMDSWSRDDSTKKYIKKGR